MDFKMLGRKYVLASLLAGLASSSIAAVQLTKAQGDALERKIDEIVKNGSSNPVRPKKTVISEPEVASYLAFNGKKKIPRGLANPAISMLGNGNLAGRVFVDIDEFKRQRGSSGFMDPLSYVSGQVPLTARGVLTSRDGRGHFQLGSAEILGVPVPKSILQELVSFFSRTPEYPDGFNIEEPFNLPAKIRQVAVHHGEALIVQ